MSDRGGKSKYQKKLARKKGRAKPNPRWMWWYSRGNELDLSAVTNAKA